MKQSRVVPEIERCVPAMLDDPIRIRKTTDAM